ncbi:MAG: InlB B-repeat-containing protein [Erysipelotrichaceae bacterium]|nr:InlB B-repeat-containing protein [Erysipelotrichaceae bacterium]
MKKLFTVIMTVLLLAGTFSVSPKTVSADDGNPPGDVTISLVGGDLQISSDDTEWISALSYQSEETRIQFVEVIDDENRRTAGYVEMRKYEYFETINNGKTLVVPADQIPVTIYDGTFLLYLSAEGYDGFSISNNTIVLNRGYDKYIHIILHANGGTFYNQNDPQEFDMIRGQTLEEAYFDDYNINLWPEKEGYCCIGWFDENDNHVETNSDRLISDTELYAHWSSLSVVYDDGLYVYTDNEEWLDYVTEDTYYSDHNRGIHMFNSFYTCIYNNTYAYNILERGDGYIYISEKNLINRYQLQDCTFDCLYLLTESASWSVEFTSFHLDGVKNAPADVKLRQDEDGNLIISSDDKDYLRALTDPCILNQNAQITTIGSRIGIADQYTTSSDARNRSPIDWGCIANTQYEQPIVYDEENGVAIVSYEALTDNYLQTDEYRFYIDASGYQVTMARIDLVIPECTVTFDPDNGEDTFTETVTKGHTIYCPDPPEKEGYSFMGWYLNGELFDFTKPIMSDLTLVAGWGHLSAAYDNGLYVYCDDDDILEIVASESYYSYEQGIGMQGNTNYCFYHNSGAYHIIEKREGSLYISEKNLVNFVHFQDCTFIQINLYLGNNHYLPIPIDAFHLDGSEELPYDLKLRQDDQGNLIISSDDEDYLRALTEPCVLDEQGRITSIGSRIFCQRFPDDFQRCQKKKSRRSGILCEYRGFAADRL